MTPREVWDDRTRLLGQRVRLAGVGEVTAKFGRFLIRFKDPKSRAHIVTVSVVATSTCPLPKSVQPDTPFDLVLEAKVAGSSGGIVTLLDGEAIKAEPIP
jgi:hypothetical protein